MIQHPGRRTCPDPPLSTMSHHTSIAGRLAPELVDLVHSYLDDATLRTASLVSRDWLHIARNHITLPIAFDKRNGSTLEDVLDDPQCTLLTTIRRIHLVHPEPDVVPPLRAYLSRFDHLSWLKICGMILGEMPPLPRVRTLGLFFCIFDSQASILSSLHNLPALRNLTLRRLRWFSPSVINHAAPLLLDFLDVDWHRNERFEDILFALRPRHLMVWPIIDDAERDLATVSTYLCHLGERIERLTLQTASTLHIEQMVAHGLELGACTALRALELTSGIQYWASGDRAAKSRVHVTVSSALPGLLARLPAPLDILTLSVTPAASHVSGPVPLAKVLGDRRFTDLGRLRIVIDAARLLTAEDAMGSDLVYIQRARADVEPLIRAAMPLLMVGKVEFMNGVVLDQEKTS
ncbi:hypothetical protein MIND_01167000 [Mycena indigotica]|uniref:F-box domain-containing protein n=1 Tax=Mycena indigotica TaxID=2126181 RepID=A0A8H6S5G3_9AGAR|nr:uncharacterized protein MIND_01167000 [Mycena indigotica]KAF7292688.1 hypothetical protein MIND_01167000 [Mycena indigotica]